ncbi:MULTISPECIES: DUF4132 domain-containing protein [Glycomyces]|uniref:DUF4132 domain-containing protein n=1 Tax=Glycomyces lechevalierae TaxID=256034 RepID=A0A9X3PUA7_9ACTN|nr:DUF4132 domain-containing protein [Glycomyces lechevalierae]MDA1385733.1 DUF4132 domain-containing protein [Glycomyces lechevalierae]MDR7339853.1 hypothetical protein [Glycomyces lechevalierae]
MNDENPLPDESLLLLPAEWQEELLPRRGVRPGAVFEPDADATAFWRKRLSAQEPDLRAALAATPVPDAVEYLDGKPNPSGAGLIAEMVNAEPSNQAVTRVRLVFDAWIEEHGLPFAIGAAVAFMSFAGTRNTAHPSFTPLIEYGHRRFSDRPLFSMGEVLYRDHDLHLLRGLLADAPDAEFAAAASIVDGLRTTPARKYLAAILFPDRADWIHEAAVEVAKESWTGLLTARLAHSATSLDQFAAMRMRSIEPHEQHAGLIAPLLDGLGTDALPLLTAPTKNPLDQHQVYERLRAVAILPHDDAVAYLVEHLADPFVFEHAVAAASRFPVRTLRVIAAHAPEALPARIPLLAALAARVDPRALQALTGAEQTAVAELKAQRRPAPEAAEADLPELLVRPPWTVERPKSKPLVVRGLEPSGAVSVLWADGERERYLENAAEFDPGIVDWEQRLEWLSAHRRDRIVAEVLAYAPFDIAEQHLEGWNGALQQFGDDRSAGYLQAVLARFGASVADQVVTFLAAKSKLGALLGPIRSPGAAEAAANWFAKRPSAKEFGAAWLDRHGAAAAELLVPNALGPKKSLREPAEAALRYLADVLGRDAVLNAAKVYGEDAHAGILALLEAGRDNLPDRVPEPGDWFDTTRLPQVLLQDHRFGLPETAMRHAAVIMAIAVDTSKDPRLEELGETCDRESLREFSWAVFEQWLANGAPSADRWALAALAHFGDDETVARLTPLIKAWPGQNQHRRAVAGLQVLGGIGSEAALRAMQHISQRAKFKAIKAEAAQQIQVIAQGLGLTGEQLADRLLPDFGLGTDGSLVLDYGPRKFTVVFDEQLRPYVTDEDRKPRKALPKPGAKDDPELAGPAYQRFTALKKELRTVSVDQVRRLEAAMINARTWTRREFEEHLHGHPLMRYLTRRMVWLAQTAESRQTFRIAEDNTYTDAEDDAVELHDDAVIRLAHPVDMTAEEQGAWARLLADYEILQPFPQLARPVMAFTEEELETGRLRRFEGAVVPPGAILGLTKHGWVRGKPMDNGTEFGFHFPLPAGGYVMVELDPGLQIGMGADTEDQRFASVFLSKRLDVYHRSASGLPPRIDPVIASEVLAALDRITAKE